MIQRLLVSAAREHITSYHSLVSSDNDDNPISMSYTVDFVVERVEM